jgi:hypothetical protein
MASGQPLSALFEAVRDNDGAAVAAVLAAGGDGYEMRPPTGNNALHYAAAKSFTAAARALLAAPCGPALAAGVNVGGDTPLHFAAMGDAAGVASMLLRAGADISARNQAGTAPLAVAASNGHTACVQLLLRAGADANAVDDVRRPALHFAAAQGHTECVQALLDAGADARLRCAHGKTALGEAREGGEPRCIALLEARTAVDEAAAAAELAALDGDRPAQPARPLVRPRRPPQPAASRKAPPAWAEAEEAPAEAAAKDDAPQKRDLPAPRQAPAAADEGDDDTPWTAVPAGGRRRAPAPAPPTPPPRRSRAPVAAPLPVPAQPPRAWSAVAAPAAASPAATPPPAAAAPPSPPTTQLSSSAPAFVPAALAALAVPDRFAWAERVVAHLEAAHPVLGALEVTAEHLLGLRLSTLSAAQLDAAEAFAAQQSRALRDAQLAVALATARAEAAEAADRAREQQRAESTPLPAPAAAAP